MPKAVAVTGAMVTVVSRARKCLEETRRAVREFSYSKISKDVFQENLNKKKWRILGHTFSQQHDRCERERCSRDTLNEVV